MSIKKKSELILDPADGQTGSGKSYSVFGPLGVLDAHVQEVGPLPCDYGIVLRAACEILDTIRRADGSHTGISASMQYVQVYNEQVRTESPGLCLLLD